MTDTCVLHLSDVHATVDGRLYDRVDGIARLDTVGDCVRESGIAPDVVVITGDLVERGHAAAYPELARALLRLEERVEAPVLTVLGNHDDPAHARVLPGHASAHHRLVHLADLRILLLDSSSGMLGRDQIAWVREAIAQPYGRGTLLALHHPPLASPLAGPAGLVDAPELLAAIAGSDVRAILAGHLHHPLTANLSGVSVSVGPSLAYHRVMNAGPGFVAGHDSPMLSLVHLLADTIAVTTVDLHAPPSLFSTPVSAGPLTAPLTTPLTTSR
ncbi:3',5'-cyclic adenosine monophosphate phosphodiesterase CpdA [Brevibacterium casei]|uniref:3',5'-cyclic adenosine monophosphate phosphodiesterase CpdA n=1 Tax=Brevibacterium casei TaxID=33889 RepID=A0A449DBV7_9MICO|nr:metallophosphoesterase [Brevibacterium casei]QPS34372.1 metallophosphoesterase [Brevibacterium casei]VEW15024.1 3',5'-cyclic adenosine monophosphate phosphodiesterase CpdA [Brevibacterium casei]